MAGILAGLHSKTGIVGYLAPFPALATRRDVNAFALGVLKVRPEARILVQWTGQWISPEKENKALYILKHEGADVITYFAASQHPAQEAAALGLDYIDFHGAGLKTPPHCLASIETDWQQVMGCTTEETMLVVEGIGHDPSSWLAITGGEIAMTLKPSVTFDLYYCGIAQFNQQREKQNYIVNF